MKRFAGRIILILGVFFSLCVSANDYVQTNIPIINIETKNQIERKEYVYCSLSISGDIPKEWISSYDSVRIRGRGNTTWEEMPKKAYKIKFNKKESLFGEPKDKEWVLLANYSDETLLRTAIAFYMGSKSCLAWTPCSHFVELYLNGENQGIYQLTEQIKISKNRVNISEAGCLLEVDSKWSIDEDDVWFETDRLLLNIKDPKIQYGDDQYNWVSSYVKDAEDVLYGELFKDKDLGYNKYFDIESFVDWYVISEITKNYDSQFHYSCWMSVEPGGKIKMGPLWDFDLCMGNWGWGNRQLPEYWCQPEDFWLKGNTVWIDRMLEDDVFYEKVVDRMSYYTGYIDDICSFIDEQGELLKEQIIRNEKIWHTLNNNSSDDESIYDSYKVELNNLKQWIITRMEWLCDEYKAKTTIVTNVKTYKEDCHFIDLLGRRIVRKNRGPYIVNGKKVIKL